MKLHIATEIYRMVEGVGKSTFLSTAKLQIESIRNLLCAQSLSAESLNESIQVINSIKVLATDSDTLLFKSIAERLQLVLLRHIDVGTVPNHLELEMIRLAVDWLNQLVIFYREDLPEPKSLIAELLYAFDLIERCHVAETKVDEPPAQTLDPFLDDSDFNLNDQLPKQRTDFFDEDPGFGLEFDLLQRTINFVSEMTKVGDDPFASDPQLPDAQ